jgi:hypothetical protein
LQQQGLPQRGGILEVTVPGKKAFQVQNWRL